MAGELLFHKGASIRGLLPHRGWAGAASYHHFTSFEAFIEAYCDPNASWHCAPLKDSQIAPVIDDDTQTSVADFLLPCEKITVFLEELSKKTSLKVECQHLNENRNNTRPALNEIYTDLLRKKVEEKCARELALFGYSFDGFNPKAAETHYDGLVFDRTLGLKI